MPTGLQNFTKTAYFPTLVFQASVAGSEALNQKLLDAIYADRDEDEKGLVKSNVAALGGWHSGVSIHKAQEYSALVKNVNDATKRLSEELGYSEKTKMKIGSMWSIVNPPGAMNVAHVHPGCMWSGVYYVQSPENSGNISFTDPRTVQLMNQAKFQKGQKRPRDCWTKVNFTPRAGKIIIFPSWLYHSVNVNKSEEKDRAGNRVIVSFNISQHNR